MVKSCVESVQEKVPWAPPAQQPGVVNNHAHAPPGWSDQAEACRADTVLLLGLRNMEQSSR